MTLTHWVCITSNAVPQTLTRFGFLAHTERESREIEKRVEFSFNAMSLKKSIPGMHLITCHT